MNNRERDSRKVWSAAAGYDRGNDSRKLRGSHDGRARSCASTELAQVKILCFSAAFDPRSRVDQAFCQKGDVETKFAAVLVDCFFPVG